MLNVCKPTVPSFCPRITDTLYFWTVLKVPLIRVYRELRNRRSREWLQYLRVKILTRQTQQKMLSKSQSFRTRKVGNSGVTLIFSSVFTCSVFSCAAQNHHLHQTHQCCDSYFNSGASGACGKPIIWYLRIKKLLGQPCPCRVELPTLNWAIYYPTTARHNHHHYTPWSNLLQPIHHHRLNPIHTNLMIPSVENYPISNHPRIQVQKLIILMCVLHPWPLTIA